MRRSAHIKSLNEIEEFFSNTKLEFPTRLNINGKWINYPEETVKENLRLARSTAGTEKFEKHYLTLTVLRDKMT